MRLGAVWFEESQAKVSGRFSAFPPINVGGKREKPGNFIMEKMFFFPGFLHVIWKILTSLLALFFCHCYFYSSKTLQLPSIASIC